MSTATRRSHAEALFAAEHFRDLFSTDLYERWEFAGSLRRRSPDVGDLEHVVLPRFGDAPADDLFGTPKRVNLLFRRMDELLAAGVVARHIYANGFRWGQKHRGVDFACLGVTAANDVYCADADNWGPTLAIRTGSGDFSRRLVTGLLRNGMRNKDGKVWRCTACACGRAESCKACEGTGLVPEEAVSVPTEEAYFSLCGVTFVSPEKRI